MSHEELHKFLLDFEAGDIDYAKTFCDLCCKDAALERKSTDCEGCLLWWLKNDATLPQGIDWLKQPVKEEHHETIDADALEKFLKRLRRELPKRKPRLFSPATK